MFALITRHLTRLRKLVPHELPRYPKRTRAAKRRMQELQRMTASQRDHQQLPKYRELIAITEEALKNARHAVQATTESKGRTLNDVLALEVLRKQITLRIGGSRRPSSPPTRDQ